MVPWGGLVEAAAIWDSDALARAAGPARTLLGQAAAIAFSLFAWAYIYHVRALTEERHLSMDAEYRAYCARVRWRYVPGVY
jgi:protein-S-isoprenylcysteine O-methyltransferase Ste14